MKKSLKLAVAMMLALGVNVIALPYAEAAIISKSKIGVERVEVQSPVPVKILADYRKAGYSGVLDLGTYSSYDYDKQLAIMNSRLSGNPTEKDLPKTNCTALLKPININGKMVTVMGRNMDLPNSYYPIYIFRMNVPGKYKTINVGYVNNALESFDQIAETSSVDKRMYDALPFKATDVLNEKGLLIETNMRESHPELNVTGTHPGKMKVCTAFLQRFLGDNCATIDDVLKYVETLDLYTANTSVYSVNQELAITDATGRFGVLEFIKNKAVWHEGFPGQTNFWIDTKAREIAKTDEGYGRWNTLMRNYNYIKTPEDMLNAMKKIWYSETFHKEARYMAYDPATELTNMNLQEHIDNAKGWAVKHGIKLDPQELAAVQKLADEQKAGNIRWSSDYVTAPENQLKVYTFYDFMVHVYNQLPTDALKLSGCDEVSSISYVANPEEKVFHVRFSEQPEIFHFGFDGLTKTKVK